MSVFKKKEIMEDINTYAALQYAREHNFSGVNFVVTMPIGDVFVATISSEEEDSGRPLYIVVNNQVARFASINEADIFMKIKSL